MIPTTPTIHLELAAGRCGHLLDDAAWSTCRASCARVVGVPVAGRRPVQRAYCDEHGGEERARAEVGRAWSMVAPASVGGDDAVLDAGNLSLCSEHVYLVLREERGRWLAFRGIGSHVQPVPAGPPRQRGAKRKSKASYTFASRDEAFAAGLAAWRAGIEATVATITAARGGTLAWGAPVEPRSEPIILEPLPGQSAYAADAVRELRLAAPEAVVSRGEAGRELGTVLEVGARRVIVTDSALAYVAEGDGAWRNASTWGVARLAGWLRA